MTQNPKKQRLESSSQIPSLVEGEEKELYDLENDPEELTNLALDSMYREKLKTMRAKTLAELRRTDAGMVDHLPSTSTSGK